MMTSKTYWTTLKLLPFFLDKELCIKRFTPKATELINLIPADVGRPIYHIVSKLKYEFLLENAENVLKNLKSIVTDVQDKNDNWYTMRIIPYCTINNIVEGVVITFLSIQKQKQVEEEAAKLTVELQTAIELLESIQNSLHNPMLILEENFNISSANSAFYNAFSSNNNIVFGKSIYSLINNKQNLDILEKALEKVALHRKPVEDLTIRDNFKEIGDKTLRITIQKLPTNKTSVYKILFIITEITDTNNIDKNLNN